MIKGKLEASTALVLADTKYYLIFPRVVFFRSYFKVALCSLNLILRKAEALILLLLRLAVDTALSL